MKKKIWLFLVTVLVLAAAIAAIILVPKLQDGLSENTEETGATEPLDPVPTDNYGDPLPEPGQLTVTGQVYLPDGKVETLADFLVLFDTYDAYVERVDGGAFLCITDGTGNRISLSHSEADGKYVVTFQDMQGNESPLIFNEDGSIYLKEIYADGNKLQSYIRSFEEDELYMGFCVPKVEMDVSAEKGEEFLNRHFTQEQRERYTYINYYQCENFEETYPRYNVYYDKEADMLETKYEEDFDVYAWCQYVGDQLQLYRKQNADGTFHLKEMEDGRYMLETIVEQKTSTSTRYTLDGSIDCQWTYKVRWDEHGQYETAIRTYEWKNYRSEYFYASEESFLYNKCIITSKLNGDVLVWTVNPGTGDLSERVISLEWTHNGVTSVYTKENIPWGKYPFTP